MPESEPPIRPRPARWAILGALLWLPLAALAILAARAASPVEPDPPAQAVLHRASLLLAALALVPALALLGRAAGRPGLRGTAARAVLVLAALLPFASVYQLHFARNGPDATGFIHSDMYLYIANGRAAFLRADGFLHPNPHDPDPASPAIYFHWFTWFLGFAVERLGASPAAVFLASGALAALAVARLVWALVVARGAPPAARVPLFLALMWGAGVAALFTLAENLARGLPLWAFPARNEPFNGWWLTNWGRSLVFPTEALYHVFVAAAWLAIVRDRVAAAVAAVLVLAATHPWSGAQHLLILDLWLLVLLLRRRAPLPALAAAALGTALFGWYYAVHLPSFPQHDAIRRSHALDWSATPLAFLLAHGPAAACALLRLLHEALRRLRRLPAQWRSCDAFFLLAALVSAILSNHHHFATPHQPIHFDRGYVSTPLLLFALPTLARIADLLVRRAPAVLLCLALAIASLDNIVWLASLAGYDNVGVPLDPPRRAVLERLAQEPPGTVVLSEDANLAMVLPALTPCVPWRGYEYYTPDYERRTALSDAFFRRGDPALLDLGLDLGRDPPVAAVVALRASRPIVQSRLLERGFEVALETPSLVLYLRDTPPSRDP